jgi:hypothetical protein
MYGIFEELKNGELKQSGVAFASKTLAQEAIQAYQEEEPTKKFVICPTTPLKYGRRY